MEARYAFSIFVIYYFIYYAIARRALKMHLVESRSAELELKIGMSTSFRTLSLMFNFDVPKPDSSSRLRGLIWTARMMFAIAPFLFIGLMASISS